MVITCISLVNRSPWYELLPFECHTALSHSTDNSTCILWVQLRNKRNYYINCIQQSNRENRQLQCASKVTSSPIFSIVTRQINCTITQRLVALIWYASIMVFFTVRIYRFLAYVKVYHIDVIDDFTCVFFNVCQCISNSRPVISILMYAKRKLKLSYECMSTSGHWNARPIWLEWKCHSCKWSMLNVYLAIFSFWTLLFIPPFKFLQSILVYGMQIKIFHIDCNLINF